MCIFFKLNGYGYVLGGKVFSSYCHTLLLLYLRSNRSTTYNAFFLHTEHLRCPRPLTALILFDVNNKLICLKR